MPLTAGEAAALAHDRREAQRIHDTSYMLLIWLRHSFTSVLDLSGHRIRGSLESRPVDRLIALLADGVVLADVVATLAPTRLSPNAVLRVAPRNALSAPPSTTSSSAPASAVSNVDARQRQVQYNTNTRRVLAAVKKLLDAVRSDAHLSTTPGVVDDFVANASAVPPAKDVRPVLRLTELVLAAAVYSPDKNCRDIFWQLPSDSVRNTFHKSLTSVAQAVDLPPPDFLYADGPSASPSSSHHPPVPQAHPRSLPSAAAATTPTATAAAAQPLPTGPPGLVDLSRKHQAEAFAPPLVDENTAQPHPGMLDDDGMGGRKISLVTDDENHSRDSLSPPRLSARHTQLSYATVISDEYPGEQRVDERYVGTMHTLERGQAAAAAEYDYDDDDDDQSRSASEEFFTPHEHTPREHSPTPPPQSTDEEEEDEDDEETSRPQQEVAPPMQYPGVAPYRVDETVRQSVTTSITRQISVVPEFEGGDSQPEPLSGDMSSLDLGTRDAGASTDPAPIGFMNPAYPLSPSISDIPEPSNQWQVHRQRRVAAEVTSPQQLFSPPQLPRGSRTATATQMTPPQAPMLFRNGSPQLSVSSVEGRPSVPYYEGQLTSKNSRGVSFAPTFKSPGGHSHPLGQPLRGVQGSSEQQGADPRGQRDRSFALPPTTASHGSASGQGYAAGEEVTGAEHLVTDRDYAERAEGYDPESVEEQYDRDGEGPPQIEDSHFDPDKDEIFEQVEEYVVTSSEHDEERYRRDDANPSTGVDMSDMRASSSGQDPTDRNQGDVRETGAAPFPNYGEESRHADVFDEAEAMVAADAGFFSPTQTPRPPGPSHAYPQSGYPTALQYREVPPTPPSPPTVAALVESFTARRHRADTVDARPISTMAPSAGLFQKLISVWKSSEDTGHEATDRDFNPSDRSLGSQLYRPDQIVSQSNTQESTLPSGDTDVAPQKRLSHAESPRSRRRRAMRMEPGSPVHQDLQRAQEMSTDSGRQSADEQGSIASFSDAFSSDKERSFLYSGQGIGEGYDWEEAMRGDESAGIPLSSNASQERQMPTAKSDVRKDSSKVATPSRSRPPLQPSPRTSRRKAKSRTTSTQGSQGKSVVTDGQHIRVDRRHLDWLTKELLNARDMLSDQELQMTFQETQRVEQEEILLLDKENAESVVGAMKHILADREKELKDARNRLSVAIEGVATTQERSSQSSRNSVSAESQNLSKLITEGHSKLHVRIDESDAKSRDVADQMTKETQGLWTEVQRAMVQQMAEMTEKRDEELEVLRRELEHRQKIVDDLQKSSADLRSKNNGIQSEVSAMRVEKDRADHRYQLEMAHVSAQVEIVNEFSKKLHDNFRETENLRQQVLQYQDKLSHITSTSGVSQRQIKELREAVTRANDECSRLRREAELAKRKGMEAFRRAEELEELHHKDAAAHSASRFPDRQARTDSGSLRSHEPIRPAGQNRPGGSGTGARYHAATRTRGMPATPTPAQKAWLVIKDKIGGIVTGKESSSSRRRPSGSNVRRDPTRSGSASRSSGSNSRSRTSPRDEEILRRSRSASVNSRSSKGSGSSIRSGPSRSRSGSRGRVSPVADTRPYMHDSPRSKEVDRIRAANFL